MSDSGAKASQTSAPLVEGQVVSGTLFSEPMRMETIRESGFEKQTKTLLEFSTETFGRAVLVCAEERPGLLNSCLTSKRFSCALTSFNGGIAGRK
jgi:hypothetical protein